MKTFKNFLKAIGIIPHSFHIGAATAAALGASAAVAAGVGAVGSAALGAGLNAALAPDAQAGAPATGSSSQTREPWPGASQFLTNPNGQWNSQTQRFEYKPAESFWFNPQTGEFEYTGNKPGPMGAYEQLTNFTSDFRDLNPNQQSALDMYLQSLGDRLPQMQDLFSNTQNLSNKLERGAYGTHYGPVANSEYTGSNYKKSDLQAGRDAQGDVNPTEALQRLLSGHPDNPYL
jgi:hypothetical protein